MLRVIAAAADQGDSSGLEPAQLRRLLDVIDADVNASVGRDDEDDETAAAESEDLPAVSRRISELRTRFATA